MEIEQITSSTIENHHGPFWILTENGNVHRFWKGEGTTEDRVIADVIKVSKEIPVLISLEEISIPEA